MFDFINKFSMLKTRRINQLEKEKKIDQILINAYNLCPKLTLQYIWLIREKHRECALKVYNSTIFEYLDETDKNLSKIEKIYEKYPIDYPIELCEKLPQIINDIKMVF